MDKSDRTRFEFIVIENVMPGPLFTKKTPFYQYRDSHYKPETVVRPSSVYNKNPYTRKAASS